jgi:hypothetical protein
VLTVDGEESVSEDDASEESDNEEEPLDEFTGDCIS